MRPTLLGDLTLDDSADLSVPGDHRSGPGLCQVGIAGFDGVDEGVELTGDLLGTPGSPQGGMLLPLGRVRDGLDHRG